MAEDNENLLHNRPQTSRDPDMERAREWWREWGKPIVAGIVIGLAAVVGHIYWQSYKETQALEASQLYERMRVMIDIASFQNNEEESADDDSDGDDESTSEQDEANAETVAAIREIADQLMSDYDSTPYSVHAAFSLAKFSVESDNLQDAAEVLEWAVDNIDDDGVLHIARIRLALIWLALGEADSVIAMLENQDGGDFGTRYYELLGDAHLQNGNQNAAARAYQHSLSSLTEQTAQRQLLQLKVDNLGE